MKKYTSNEKLIRVSFGIKLLVRMYEFGVKISKNKNNIADW